MPTPHPHHPPLNQAHFIPPANRRPQRRAIVHSNVLQPFALPAPPIVLQSSEFTCWAACYRTLSSIRRQGVMPSESDLIALFNRWVTPTGITPAGFQVEGQVAGMSSRLMRGANFSLSQIRSNLQTGYLLMAYSFISPGHGLSSHAVIVYGVNANEILVMDPAIGLTRKTLTYLRTCPGIMILTPILPDTAPAGVFDGIGHGPVNFNYTGGTHDPYCGMLGN